MDVLNTSFSSEAATAAFDVGVIVPTVTGFLGFLHSALANLLPFLFRLVITDRRVAAAAAAPTLGTRLTPLQGAKNWFLFRSLNSCI